MRCCSAVSVVVVMKEVYGIYTVIFKYYAGTRFHADVYDVSARTMVFGVPGAIKQEADMPDA